MELVRGVSSAKYFESINEIYKLDFVIEEELVGVSTTIRLEPLPKETLNATHNRMQFIELLEALNGMG